MNFDLPESHREIQRSVREFCARRVAPAARGWDEAERLPPEVLAGLAELGVLGVCVPEANEGAGLDALALAAIVEELARADGSLAWVVASHVALAALHVARFGSDDLRARRLPDAASGRRVTTWGAPDLRAPDPKTASLRAERRDGAWVLDGEVLAAAVGNAPGGTLVFARTDGPPAALTAFVVDLDASGVCLGPSRAGLGLRASGAASLRLVGCRVSDDDRVGEVGGAAGDLAWTLDRGRVALAAVALGLGEGALEAAVSYAKDRKQFGRPIADFQAIQWMLADSRTELDAARVLVHRAAVVADRGERADAESAMAMRYAGGAASRACHRALQVHGGYGYTREFPVERHLRDAKACELLGASRDA